MKPNTVHFPFEAPRAGGRIASPKTNGRSNLPQPGQEIGRYDNRTGEQIQRFGAAPLNVLCYNLLRNLTGIPGSRPRRRACGGPDGLNGLDTDDGTPA